MKLNLLKGEIASNNLTVQGLAQLIGMKPKTLYNKLNGTTQFNVDEAVKICAALNISDPAKKSLIFLG